MSLSIWCFLQIETLCIGYLICVGMGVDVGFTVVVVIGGCMCGIWICLIAIIIGVVILDCEDMLALGELVHVVVIHAGADIVGVGDIVYIALLVDGGY